MAARNSKQPAPATLDELRHRSVKFETEAIPAVTRRTRGRQPNPYLEAVSELAAQMKRVDDHLIGTSQEARSFVVPRAEMTRQFQLLYEAGDRQIPPVSVRKRAQELPGGKVKIQFWTAEKIRRPGRRSSGSSGCSAEAAARFESIPEK